MTTTVTVKHKTWGGQRAGAAGRAVHRSRHRGELRPAWPAPRPDAKDHQYNLAPGTRNILKSIHEPLNLYFYYSRAVGEQDPRLKIYGTRVRELLEEMTGARQRQHPSCTSSIRSLSRRNEDRAGEQGLTPGRWMPAGHGLFRPGGHQLHRR